MDNSPLCVYHDIPMRKCGELRGVGTGCATRYINYIIAVWKCPHRGCFHMRYAKTKVWVERESESVT